MIDPYLVEGYAATATNIIQNNKVRRKLTASEPEKIQAIEGRYTAPYMEHASLDPNVGAKQRELEVKLKAEVKAKVDFSIILANKLKEASDVHDRIVEQHQEASHPATDDCTETLSKLEEAYSKVHERLVKEYGELGEISKRLYGGR
jgi:hypothetical protein